MSGDAKYISLYYSLVHQSASDFYKEIAKAPGGNMSYIPPWVPSGSAGGHYPPHMIPPQQPASAHSPQSTLSSSSPLGSPQIYQSLSPVSKTPHNNVMLTPTNTSPKATPSTTLPPPSPPISSSVATTSVSQAAAAAAAATAAAVAAAVAASASSAPNSSPTEGNHTNSGNVDSPYEPQGYGPPRPLSPSKHHHDIKSEIPGLHNLPELALGLAGPSAFDPKAHRKYVRRSPGKYPAPEQLPTPVMYSYQGRGRPRKHFTHATGLPTMVPVTHPSSHSDDQDDEENKPFKCNVCCKGFKLKGGLQQHERTHSTDRPYVCPDCGKLFRQPTHLQQHMRIHTGEKPYDCTFCDKSFRQRTILNQHLRIHTGEKPYVCMECGKQFRQKAILDQHYRTHLGDKPYACPHPSCRKHFREMASLISHMKCHRDVPDPKIVLQQAKRLIKEEKMDEYVSHEGNSIGGSGSNIEVLTVPHPPGLSNSHDGPPERDPGGGERYQNNNGEHHGTHNSRSYSSPSASTNANQRSPHSMHAQSQGSSNTTNEAQSLPHSQSIPSGMMPTPPQMAMANLIPYPHSIFPATSYMMPSPPDPRQYHQLPSSAASQSPAATAAAVAAAASQSSLPSRPNQ